MGLLDRVNDMPVKIRGLLHRGQAKFPDGSITAATPVGKTNDSPKMHFVALGIGPFDAMVRRVAYRELHHLAFR